MEARRSGSGRDADVGVAGDPPAPGGLVTLSGAQADADGVAGRGGRRRAIVEEEHRTGGEVGAVEVAGEAEGLAQAGGGGGGGALPAGAPGGGAPGRGARPPGPRPPPGGPRPPPGG